MFFKFYLKEQYNLIFEKTETSKFYICLKREFYIFTILFKRINFAWLLP